MLKGTDNILDVLSRNPIDRDQSLDQRMSPCIYFTTPRTLLEHHRSHIQDFRHILQGQRRDSCLRKIMGMFKGDKPLPVAIAQRYCIYEGILLYRRHPTSDLWLVCVPSHSIDELVVKFHHYFGHVGPKKYISVIKDMCFFKGLCGKVRRIVKSCDLYQKSKYSTIRVEGEMQHVMANAPLDRVCVDLNGPLPPGWNKTIFIFVELDCFLRFVRLFPIKRSTARVITNRMIKDYIANHGTPKIIVSDHGVQFVSKIWQNSLTNLGIRTTTKSVYHPQSNPAERVMRELGRRFRSYCHDQHTEWPRYVQYIEWVLNNTIHKATGFTPQELFLKESRYSPIYEAIEYPSDSSEDHNVKLTLTNSVQRTKAEQ